VVSGNDNDFGISRRSYGTGRLFLRADSAGRESWYGSWWAARRRVKRKLGPKRLSGTSVGLTRRQAEAELRRRMEEAPAAVLPTRATFRQLAEQHLHHLESALDRKPTTLHDYRIILRRHLYPAFGDTPLDRLTADAVAAYMATKRRDGLSANTVRNQLNLLHAILRRAVRRGQLAVNPVDQIDRPRVVANRDRRLRFLQSAQLDALLAAIPPDPLGSTEEPLYLTAAMTGLRQGELLALRWRDVDFRAGRVRVADSYTRGRLGAPKSHSALRSVPMAQRVGAALAAHRQRSAYSADDDLAFAHPHTGNYLDASKVRKRFQRALKRAELPELRFHDLRHTFGTQMAAAGAPLRAIQEWMGHADPATTAIYAHYAPDPTHGADLVNRAFGPR
jgi:integrase